VYTSDGHTVIGEFIINDSGGSASVTG